jgi:hypothetical protein
MQYRFVTQHLRLLAKYQMLPLEKLLENWAMLFVSTSILTTFFEKTSKQQELEQIVSLKGCAYPSARMSVLRPE